MGNTNKSKNNSDINQLAADNVQSMISKTLSGLNLNSSNSNILPSKNYQNIIISYPDSSEELDMLPIELWSEILLLVDDKSLAKIVPRVSRLLYHFTSQDSDIWKRKCEIKYKNTKEPKPDHLSWKQFYWMSAIKFFPLFNITIGKTTHTELCALKGANARVSGSSRYVEVKEVNFWVNSDNNLFTSMYICRGIYIIPKEWEEHGLTWDKSFNEYKEWCKKTFGNYKVTEVPHKTEFQGEMCFTASLETYVREALDVLYMFKLDFNFTPGDENTKETLYSISTSSYNDLNQSKADFEQQVDERKCDDG